MQKKTYREELQKQAVAGFLHQEHPYFHGAEVLVFIPVHNEEYTIADVVEKVRQSCDFDLMVIDDGSFYD